MSATHMSASMRSFGIRGLKAAAVGLGLVAALGAGSVSAYSGPDGAGRQDQEVSPYVQAVLDQFAGLIPVMAENGYANYDVVALDGLANGANASFQYTTQDSGVVVFVGACDNDCTDLDLRVSGGGRLIGEDVLEDAVPIVQVPAGARPLTVEVVMAACSAEPCIYGVLVFRP